MEANMRSERFNINILSPLEEIYFIKKLMANKEEKKVVIKPTNRGRNGNIVN